jgi:LmbE family N-acetylglucosaminyl deacetylase
MQRFTILLAVAAFSFQLTAQQVRPANSNVIYRELAQLNKLVNVLYVAAHPDDENTRLLGWLVNDQNVRAAYLSITRGDGGQNILGSEQGPALGLIRTHELLEARKIDGPEQFFTRATDFGYSKNTAETFKHWNEDLLTKDVAWVYRTFRPDVVICRFPATQQAGHGQHSASAVLAERAFKASGDANRYPEQLKTVSVWQPKRLLFNSFRFGNTNTTSEDQFKIKVGQYNPGFGMGYGELAGMSRSIHKSQGAGTPSTPGIQTEYFTLIAGEPLRESLYDGIDITWGRVGRKDIGARIEGLMRVFDFRNPGAILPDLIALRRDINGVQDAWWRAEKLRDLDKIILHCSGFLAELYARQPVAVAGAVLPFTLRAIARAGVPVTLTSVQWPGGETTPVNARIDRDSLISIDQKIAISADAAFSEPFWLSKQSTDPAHYTLPDDALSALPEKPNTLNAVLNIDIQGFVFSVPVPLSFKKTDPVKGDVVEALRVVPDVALEFTQPLLVAQPDGSVQASLRLHAEKDLENGVLNLDHAGQVLASLPNLRLKAGSDTVVSLRISPRKSAQTGGFKLNAQIDAAGKTYQKTQHLIRYDHIPTLQYFTPASVKVLQPDWVCTARKIGCVEGAGDNAAAVLQLAGLNVEILKESDFNNPERLQQYDAILTGVRAVNTEKRMKVWLPILHQYVQNGGTLVMQYNTQQDLATTEFGPYPFKLSNTRVAEEDAPVKFTKPEHRLLNYPNKINEADFANWVQERCLNVPAAGWDARYETMFEMNDGGENPLSGATLYAPYRKGHYVYSTLAFFRQFPAGHPGAIRLMMNMLSVGK